MRRKIIGWLFCVLAALGAVDSLKAQGTVFTYQGQLTDGGQPANGTNYGMVFYLYDAPTNGNLLGNLGIPSITVSNGLFTTPLDFGIVFDGTPRWLEISVQKNGGAFTTLSPRQPILPTPYAIFANTASNLSGSLPTAQLTGTFPAGQLSGTVANAQLASNSITVNAGKGLGGGGAVPLGGSTTLTNAGVLSVTGSSDITASTVGGAVTLGDTATSAATPNLIVKRDSGGSFSTENLTLTGNLNLPATTATAGIIYSGGNPLMHSYGISNFFAGSAAGNLKMSGSYNMAAGQDAFNHNTSGSFNTASGQGALYYNTSGSYNTADGQASLQYNTIGSLNTASGETALFTNNIGSNNVANGQSALHNNTSGSYNTAAGAVALFNNTTGNNNIGLGYQAGINITTGSNNVDIGSAGVSTDSGTIRIGAGNVQTNTFVAGISGTTVTNASLVTVSASGQLGSMPPGLTTNIDIGGHTLYITNGIIMNVQ